MNNPRTAARTRPTPPETKPAPPRPGRKPAGPVEAAWNEVANFVLTFESRTLASGASENRITAHKMQDGGLTEKWTGTEQQPMVRWISEHVGDWPEAAAKAAAEPAHSSVAQADPPPYLQRSADPDVQRDIPAAFRLTVSSLQPVLNPFAGADPRHAAVHLSGARIQMPGATPFDLEAAVSIDALNDTAAASGSSVRCVVEFFCRNTRTAEKTRLGEAYSGGVAGARSSCTAALRGVRLAPGSYRLACVARLTGAGAPPAFLQGPWLEVD